MLPQAFKLPTVDMNSRISTFVHHLILSSTCLQLPFQFICCFISSFLIVSEFEHLCKLIICVFCLLTVFSHFMLFHVLLVFYYPVMFVGSDSWTRQIDLRRTLSVTQCYYCKINETEILHINVDDTCVIYFVLTAYFDGTLQFFFQFYSSHSDL